MNTPTVVAERSLKLPGLVSRDYCVLAATAQTHRRPGTIWTEADGFDYLVNGKNYHRPTDLLSIVTIDRLRLDGPGKPAMRDQYSAETTAVGMFEIACVDERYESDYIITHKDYQAIVGAQWRSVVYGTPVASVDPYVTLFQDQMLLSARLNDTIREGATQRPTSKEYVQLANSIYSIRVISPNGTRTSTGRFNRDDMFRTLTPGDTYIDQSGD
ncbi:hypothetical protein ACQKP7_18470 [Pseudomonas frederiksbergensis]|uniref:hypothetical protein n=1 Tax=Pseudomonas frederiksbergensis TaxID=104087 RepID=UPI003D02D468